MANFEQKLTKIEKLDSRILNEIWDKFIELHATNQIQEQNEKGFWTTYEEILSNDNNWTISRYDPLLKKLDDLQYRIKLEEYVKIIDFHEIPKNQKNMKEVRLLSPSDIDETGFIKSGGKKVEAPESYLKDYSVKANDLIFCIRGNVGKIGIITHAEENSIINPQLVILRKNDPVVSMILLYSNLKQKFVQIQIDSLKYGSVIYGININDIKNIRLPLPNEYEKTEEETKMTKLRFKIFEQRSKIHELENELTKMLTDLKEKEQ